MIQNQNHGRFFSKSLFCRNCVKVPRNAQNPSKLWERVREKALRHPSYSRDSHDSDWPYFPVVKKKITWLWTGVSDYRTMVFSKANWCIRHKISFLSNRMESHSWSSTRPGRGNWAHHPPFRTNHYSWLLAPPVVASEHFSLWKFVRIF